MCYVFQLCSCCFRNSDSREVFKSGRIFGILTHNLCRFRTRYKNIEGDLRTISKHCIGNNHIDDTRVTTHTHTARHTYIARHTYSTDRAAASAQRHLSEQHDLVRISHVHDTITNPTTVSPSVIASPSDSAPSSPSSATSKPAVSGRRLLLPPPTPPCFANS